MKKRTKLSFLILAMLLAFISCSVKRPVTVYTIGDSTMASYDPKAYPLTGWCQVLQQYFDDGHVTVKNHGASGRSSKSFISEGRWKAVWDSLNPGDYVFIQFGHNDEKESDTQRYAAPYGLYQENLRKFVDETRAKKAIPVLFTPIARRKFGENEKLINTHGEYLDAVKQLSVDKDVLLIDLHRLTTDFVNSLGEEPSKEIYLWTPPDGKFPAGKKDNTHLSEKGAKEYAGLAVRELLGTDCPLRNYLRKGIEE